MYHLHKNKTHTIPGFKVEINHQVKETRSQGLPLKMSSPNMLQLPVNMDKSIKIMMVMNLKGKSQDLIHMIGTLEISIKILEEVAQYDHKAIHSSNHNRSTPNQWQNQFLATGNNDLTN